MTDPVSGGPDKGVVLWTCDKDFPNLQKQLPLRLLKEEEDGADL